MIGKFEIYTPKIFWIDAFVCLRSTAYWFKCGDKNTKKIKDVSETQSKNIKSEEYKKIRRWRLSKKNVIIKF